MALFAAAFIGGLILSILPKTASQVVLLPDADGKTGAVVITAEGGQQQRLASAFATATINNRGAIALRTDDSAQVMQQYGSTLAARPQQPVSFSLYFEFGSTVDIVPSFRPVLNQILQVLPSYPAAEFTVIGHTDRVGTLEFNDELSLRRATTVRDLMVQAGIPASSIDVAGRGEREPLVPTADEVPEEKNRRVEINLR